MLLVSGFAESSGYFYAKSAQKVKKILTIQACLEGKTILGKTIKALGQWFCP